MISRKISQPIFLSPRNEQWDPCVFREGCGRVCMPPNPPKFSELMKKRFSKEISHWASQLKDSKGCHWNLKNKYAMEITRLLEGSVVPSGDHIGEGRYFVCGEIVPGLGPRIMQAFGPEDVLSAAEGITLEVPLDLAYVHSAFSAPMGLNSPFSLLLARIAVRGLEEDRWALRALETEGGLIGMRTLALMAAEPTIPFHTRNSFIESLERIASCISLEGKTPEVEDLELGVAISRFSTMEEVLGIFEGHVHANIKEGKNSPPMPEEPDFAKAMQVCAFAFGSIFQAMMNLSSRIDSIFSLSDLAALKNKNLIAGYYRNLEKAIGLLAGKYGPNKKLFIAVGKLLRKRNEMLLAEVPGNVQELYVGEHMLARKVVLKMAEEGRLDDERAEVLLGLICKKEPEEWWNAFPEAEKFSRELTPK